MVKKNLAACVIAALLLMSAVSVSAARPDADFNVAPQAVWLARNVGAARETIAFDVTTQRARFILPNGLRSADGSAYWAAFQAGGMTALHSFDVANGSIRASFGLDGVWELGAISATGKWLVLKRAASEIEKAEWTKANAWKTTIAVVDAETRKTTRTLTLDGNFDVDALNTQGSALYLIQHLPALKPDHYQVRKYDVALGQLQDAALVDKRNINEVMAGYARDAVASPNGEWLFTLYVGMHHAHAFIHALNLREGYAWCIDLPSSEGDAATLEHYALALAPDGHTIYASNAVLGALAIADVANIGEPRVVRFAPFAKKSDAPIRDAIVTSDGKRVFFSDANVVWQYDTATTRAQELKRGTMPILDLAMNADNSELFFANVDHSVSALSLTENASSALNKNACPITRPPAQPFVPAGYAAQLPYGEFYYGTEKLWTRLYPKGQWGSLPYYDGAYSQKVWWWRKGFVGTTEQQPALQVTGKQLDGNATLVASRATSGYASDLGGWAMLVGVEVPQAGCWEFTGEYGGEKLSFVVQVLP